jgi:hypothetical protein
MQQGAAITGQKQEQTKNKKVNRPKRYSYEDMDDDEDDEDYTDDDDDE